MIKTLMLPIAQIEAVAPERIHPSSAQGSLRAWHFFVVVGRVAYTTGRQETSLLLSFAFLQPEYQFRLLRDRASAETFGVSISQTKPLRVLSLFDTCRSAFPTRNRLPLPRNRAICCPVFGVLGLRSLSSLLMPKISHHMRTDDPSRLFIRIDDELKLLLERTRIL